LGSVRIGFGVPRYVGDQPSIVEPPDHRQMLRYDLGARHLICSIGGRMFTLRSDAMLDVFASEVLPRVRR
jgi:hypothetical protein